MESLKLNGVSTNISVPKLASSKKVSEVNNDGNDSVIEELNLDEVDVSNTDEAGYSLKSIKSLVATGATIALSLVQTIGDFGETILAGGFNFEVGKLVNSNSVVNEYGVEIYTNQGTKVNDLLKEKAKEVVVNEVVNTSFDDFYDKNTVGNSIKSNSVAFETVRDGVNGLTDEILKQELVKYGPGIIFTYLFNYGNNLRDLYKGGSSFDEANSMGTVALSGVSTVINKSQSYFNFDATTIKEKTLAAIYDGDSQTIEWVIGEAKKVFGKNGYTTSKGEKIEFSENDDFLDRLISVIEADGGLKEFGIQFLSGATVSFAMSSLVSTISSKVNKLENMITSKVSASEIGDVTNVVRNNTNTNNIKNMKNEILDTLSSDMNEYGISRKLYIELNKRVNFNSDYLVADKNLCSYIYRSSQKIDFENLDSEYIVCSGWSKLYKDLLVSSGFDESKISIMGKNGHDWVEIMLDDGHIIIADATDNIKGSNDLANCKLSLKTKGFVYTGKEFSGYRVSRNSDFFSFAKEQWYSVDKNIEYSYNDQVVSKANDLFGKSKLYKKMIGNSFEKELIKFEPSSNISGDELYNYYKKILENNTSKVNYNLYYQFRKNTNLHTEFVTCLGFPNISTYIVYSKELGKKTFYNEDDYILYLRSLRG